MLKNLLFFFYQFKFFKRIIPSVLRKISFFKKSQIINLNHFKINLHFKASIDREIFLKKEYEPKQINFLTSQFNHDKFDLFLDVGSYIGYYSLYLSNKVKDIYAFEPNIENYKKLKKNISINNLSIKTFNCACSDFDGNAKIWFTDANKLGGSSVFDKNDKEINKYDYDKIMFEKINVSKLDSLVNVNQKRIIVKIDVERHELKVLEGAKKLINNNKIFLQIEIFDSQKNIILDYLYKNGFKIKNNINKDYFLSNY
jgi:FkbM family methyltransferase